MTTRQENLVREGNLEHDEPSTLGLYLDDCKLMLRFLRDSERPYETSAAMTVLAAERATDSRGMEKDVIEAHQALRKSVSPATPSTLRYHYSRHQGVDRLNFSEPLMKRLMVTTFVILSGFIFLSLDPAVTGLADIEREHGRSLFLNEIYLALAAAMGATFSALFKAEQYVSRAAFDPGKAVHYWAHILLGVVAGLMLSVLAVTEVPLDQTSTGTLTGGFSQALVAMLGGFSSSAVYALLQRFVETLSAAVHGSGEHSARAKYETHAANEKIQYEKSLADVRQQQVVKKQQLVSQLQNALTSESPEEGIRNLVEQLTTERQ